MNGKPGLLGGRQLPVPEAQPGHRRSGPRPGPRPGGTRAERLVPSGYSKAGKAHGCVAGLGCSEETLGQGPPAPGSTCPWVHLPWCPPAPGSTCPGSTCPGVHLPWPSWAHKLPTPCPTTQPVGNACQVQPHSSLPCLSPCALRKGVLRISSPWDPL